MRIGLVTCKKLPEPDPDQEPLLDALGRAGAEAKLIAWDDPAVSAADFDLCVLRSTWNYYKKPAEFLQWVEAAHRVTRLLNPIEIIRWNLHKDYLQELADRSIPIVPTEFFKQGTSVSLQKIVEARGWFNVVIKPAISAASFLTRRFNSDHLSAAQDYLDDLLIERDVMVQQYMASVENGGERALVWITGAFTHALQKQARFTGGKESVINAKALNDEERALGEQVLSGLESKLLYARVDVMRDSDGQLRLSELELMEPSLFLVQYPPALELFSKAIVNAV